MSSARAASASLLLRPVAFSLSPPVGPAPARHLEVPISSPRSLWTQLAIALAAALAIVVAANISRPYYVSRAPVGAQLIAHRYVDSSQNRAPWLRQSTELALGTPQFLLDRELFAMDLLRTGKLNQERARALADVAVREAYTRKVPPALVLGVMLTENDELKSSARSKVGAVGLMQVHARPWQGLSRKFGSNVKTDSTNLKYGIYILGWVAGKAAALVEDQDAAWRKALLRYNGCVHGSNTRDCHAYPDVVRREVERSARSSCRGANFDRCVAEPMWLARRDGTDTTLIVPR
jgi:soluble lytic murein transglycosylase-like protein